MHISAATPTHGPQGQLLTGDQRKVAESCRQFEAGLWRSLLEKALAPAAGSGPGKDVYPYFMAETIADKVAGQPGSFSSALQAQMLRTLPSSHE